ncbi:MAG: polyribonucleotide nucleotidyltransferase [Bacillota bacterium]
METLTLELAGRTLTLETGKLAKQASGAVQISYGDTVLLVTATIADEPREGIDFFPMTVDYEERLYAVGRIPGGFIKREGRPTEKATLSARLTDRPLRPLFPKTLRNSVHIVSTVLSVDQNCAPEILSIIGASAALSISKIPFDGPIGAVLVGLIDGEPVINPDLEQSPQSSVHLILAGTRDAVMMVEAGAAEVSHTDLLRCIEAGHEEIKKLVSLQDELVSRTGLPKMTLPVKETNIELLENVGSVLQERIAAALRVSDKQSREEQLAAVKVSLLDQYREQYPEHEADLKAIFEATLKETLRAMILDEGIRPDGRGTEEIRPISCEVGVLPRTHGSAVFTRGQTQVLNVCTLGALRDMQILDGLGLEESKRFIHHYNFPPYSVGESGFMRGPGRREIGHGALAERALEKVVPKDDQFPYTLRLVSEVLESNGSTSMGSVCAGSLAMMDAGVPVAKAVSGIAMGLIKEGERVSVLSDIQGIEDFLGDMDFKVAGTVDGITALQMDIKVQGISREILGQAMEQAVRGYKHILSIMNEAISEPRPELSPYAPRMITMKIEVDKIREVIGPGGRMVNKIIAETGVGIDIEPDGRIFIAAVDVNAGNKAREMIEALVTDVEPGKTYLGKVTRVERYGAFIEVLPGKEGLLHISNMDYSRVEKTEDVVNLGDQIEVKVTDIDDKGRINLSRKELMEKPPGYKDDPPPQKRRYPPRREKP